MFPRNFTVDRKVANWLRYLRTCWRHGELSWHVKIFAALLTSLQQVGNKLL